MKKIQLNKFNLYKQFQQIGRFIVTGCVNTGIDFGLLWLLLSVTGKNEGIYTLIFPALTFTVATTNSFFMNKYWTFRKKKKKNSDKGALDFSQFIAISLGGLIINAGVTFLISNWVDPFLGMDISFIISPEKTQDFWVLFSKAVATGISLVWNFVGYKVLGI